MHLLSSGFTAGELVIVDAREAIDRTNDIWAKVSLVGICLAIVSLLTGGIGMLRY